MAVPILNRVNIYIPGLERGSILLALALRTEAERQATRLEGQVKIRQRMATGEERRKTTSRITQKETYLKLRVYNPSIQAAVDETGAVPHFPPYKRGSKLFKWVERKGLGGHVLTIAQARGLGQHLGKGAAKEYRDEQARITERVSFLIARAQSRRGLPRPGDPLRKPFEATTISERRNIYEGFKAAIYRGVNSINKATTNTTFARRV